MYSFTKQNKIMSAKIKGTKNQQETTNITPNVTKMCVVYGAALNLHNIRFPRAKQLCWLILPEFKQRYVH